MSSSHSYIHPSPSPPVLPIPPYPVNPNSYIRTLQREQPLTPPSDDGTADSPSSKPPHPSTAHKLGPKANQGAINAGLRALDRSGAPCRKWARGGFAIKSFTGTTWEIPRWGAPPKSNVTVNGVNGDGKGEGGENGGKGGGDGEGDEGSSGKENKDSQVESEGAGRDVEMSSPGVQASSPAPQMVAVA